MAAKRSVNNAQYLVTRAISHKEKVMSLYKRVLRNIESWEMPDRAECRYKMVLMRQRFEENKNIKDMRIAKELLKAGEGELWKNMHPQPIKFPWSPGGVQFERYYELDDWALDYWHPYEKAQYPYYFARREKRKEEYIKLYESEYGDALKVLGVEKHLDYTVKFAPDQKSDQPAIQDDSNSNEKIESGDKKEN